jgi:hypothetical protein
VSRVLVIATLLFLAFASSVLVWEGLATGVLHGRALARSDLRRVRFRFTVGVIGFAIVFWIALGILTRAW